MGKVIVLVKKNKIEHLLRMFLEKLLVYFGRVMQGRFRTILPEWKVVINYQVQDRRKCVVLHIPLRQYLDSHNISCHTRAHTDPPHAHTGNRFTQ